MALRPAVGSGLGSLSWRHCVH